MYTRKTRAGMIRGLVSQGAQKTLRDLLILSVLALSAVMAAGCTSLSEPQLVHPDDPSSTENTPEPDPRFGPARSETGNEAPDCIERTAVTSYPMNITHARQNILSRKEFLETNREYLAFLAKELGQEKAEQMMNDEYTRLKWPVLLDPSSGNDTLITITIDPVGSWTAGRTFEITGTTNLPPGRELTLVIFAGNYDRAILPCEDPWENPVLRTAVVQAGDTSINTWSYILNTSGFESDDYLIYVRETEKEGAFLTSCLFHLY